MGGWLRAGRGELTKEEKARQRPLPRDQVHPEEKALVPRWFALDYYFSPGLFYNLHLFKQCQRQLMPQMDGSLFINMNIIEYNWYIAVI